MIRETTELEKEVFEYLHNLQDSGATNMFGASPYIEENFEIDKKQSNELLEVWMKNWNEEQDYIFVKT